MKRSCNACHNAGIKVGRVILSGSIQCACCGTEYEVSRFKELPHTVAVLLAAVFVMTWILDRLNGGVFLILSGLWLAFDLIWESTVPLRPVRREADPAAGRDAGPGAAEEQRVTIERQE